MEEEFPTFYPKPQPVFCSYKKLIIVGVFLVLIIGGYFVLAYFLHLWPFKTIPTTQQIFNNLWENVSKIQSANYEVLVSFETKDRESGIQPLEVSIPELDTIRMRYERDRKRLQDVNAILKDLQLFFKTSQKYPETLEEINKTYEDPLGSRYQYSPTEEGRNFQLIITFETEKALEIIQKENTKNTTPKVNGLTVIFDKHSATYYPFYRVQVRLPSLLEIFINQEKTLALIPSNFSLLINSSGSFHKKEAPTDSRFKLSGKINYEDLSAEAEAELLKKGDVYYFKLNRFPGIFAAGLSKLKNEWIKITPEDSILNSFLSSYVTSYQEKTKQKISEYFRIFFETANEEGLFLESKKAKKEELNGEVVYHYSLDLNSDKFADFYKHFTKKIQNQFQEKAVFSFDQTIFTLLNSKGFKQIVEYLNKYGRIDLFVDQKGYPIKLEWQFKLIPSKSVRTLEEKEIVISGSFLLSDINKPISIIPPKDYLTFSQAYMKLTGLTEEEYLFVRQTQNISTIRRALDVFFVFAKRYPDDLQQLTMTGREIEKWVESVSEKKSLNKTTNGINISYPTLSSYYQKQYKDKPLLKYIPNDVFTKKPYGYQSFQDNYNLTYQIQLPPYQKGYYPCPGIYKYDYATRRYYLMYQEGLNTADKDVIAKEAKDQFLQDTDGDGLTDTFEEYLGTDKNKKDTDGDGLNDSEELARGFDPLGLGVLKPKGTRFILF